MIFDRRRVLAAGASWAGLSLMPGNSLAAQKAPGDDRTRVILLGTKGGPPLSRSGRSNAATLVRIRGISYVIDCGYGVSRQLISAGFSLGDTRNIFITHLHSDHTLEYGGLLYNAWLSPQPPRIDAYGPIGLEAMTKAFMAYQQTDIETRIADEGMRDLRGMVTVHELTNPGPVLKNTDVTVSSCLVVHPPLQQSFAYRFDAADRSVVISGDTSYAPALARFAAGADVLIHEAVYQPGIDAIVKRATNATRLREHILASHTSTEDVGRIAAEAGVQKLVLSHMIPGDDPAITDGQWLEGVLRHFSGEVVVGQDLLEV